jgi:predicted phosphoribosyltransferase
MKLKEQKEFRNKTHLFRDRQEAGRLLADKLREYKYSDAFVLGIPSGGIPVAYEIAKTLDVPMDLIIVRKIQIPYNPEAGFGAVSPDGNVIFNESLLNKLALSRAEINHQKSKTIESIKKRNEMFRKSKPYPSLKDKTVIIVDDGLASGYTMLAAVRYVKKKEPVKIVVSVPTASEKTIVFIAPEVDELVCLNIRTGYTFAVADAYRNWYDVQEDEVLSILKDTTFSV